ncbi:MAG: hypothetical protein R3E98_03950 [Gemmatimonadota bacterium]|nr:hypothetical protein [Gemmatimonadota bacterium]
MHAFVDWLSAVMEPWIDFYGGSALTETVVMFLHLGALLAAGGLAFTLDRAVLRAPSDPEGRARLADTLHDAHRAVLVGLAVITASGVLLTLADPSVFLESRVYWAKMVAVGALLVNGVFLKRSGDRLRRDPLDARAFGGLRSAALRSAALWMISLLGGVAITLYA